MLEMVILEPPEQNNATKKETLLPCNLCELVMLTAWAIRLQPSFMDSINSSIAQRYSITLESSSNYILQKKIQSWSSTIPLVLGSDVFS